MLSLGMTLSSASADSINSDTTDNQEIQVVYADLNNEDEVKSTVEDAFAKGAKIVEVNDTGIKIVPRVNSGWQQNTKRYYYSDILHGTEGTIKCYVVTGTLAADHVTSCSLSVDYWGTGLTVENKRIVNNNSFSVYGAWKARISGFMDYVSPQQEVHLF